jgi:hypothetical protein
MLDGVRQGLDQLGGKLGQSIPGPLLDVPCGVNGGVFGFLHPPADQPARGRQKPRAKARQS